MMKTNQPLEKTMEDIPFLFAALKKYAIGKAVTRPEFIIQLRELPDLKSLPVIKPRNDTIDI